MTYSPLGAGLLTGKYGTDERPEEGRLVDNMMYKTRYGSDWVYRVAEDYTAFANEHGYNPVTLAVAWVKSHPAVTCPIIGARNVDQLEDSLAAADLDLSPDLREEIGSLSPEPPPATDRTEEQTEFNFSAKLTK
jgi:aryl-alcohol dehydrogenase-like predicted oxidoreductase